MSARDNEERSRKVYEAYRKDIDELLERIAEEVGGHAEYAQKEGMGWWAVSELGRLRETLVCALASLAEQSPADIMESLEGTRIREER